MLRKLMKHEFRATGRILLPLFGILLLTALAARFSVGFLLETDSWFLNLVGGLLTTAFGLAIFAVCLMALITMVNRFRTNLLGDEGYIMFTLPASVHQQIWSKLIVSAVWFLATGLAVVAASFILVAQQGFWQDIRWGIRQMFQGLTAYYAFNGTAFLLELLSEQQVTVPEIGTIRAKTVPFVVLTSNRARPLSEALRRRCAYLYIEYPDMEKELAILRAKLPHVDDRLCAQVALAVQKLRSNEVILKKPSIAETLDWAAALDALGIRELTPDALRKTAGFVLKNNEDMAALEEEETSGCRCGGCEGHHHG